MIFTILQDTTCLFFHHTTGIIKLPGLGERSNMMQIYIYIYIGKFFRDFPSIVMFSGLVSYMGVLKNSVTQKSSILIGFSIINHPFWGPTPIFGSTHIMTSV